MDAGAPWIEALGLQSDLPIVELTNSDLFGLDKEDDNLGTQDYGVIEPLVEITSPGQELENVESLSENSFCMLEPEVRINTQEPQTNSSEQHSEEPQTNSPEAHFVSPEPHSSSPDLQEISTEQDVSTPEREAISPDVEVMCPETQMFSPEAEPQTNTSGAKNCSTPDVEYVPQEIQLDSPEVFTIDDSPEKMQVENNPKEIADKEKCKQAINNDDRDLKKELQIKLIKIDETLTIIDNMVRLPEHMCGSESETSSTRNGRRSKVRFGNKRSPYSLRIKPEPVDEDDPSTSNAVRFNPYALSAQKPAANKRNSVSAKGKSAKGRQMQPAHSQSDEPDNDFFLPTDFLEASMSEGNSPDKKQTWSGSDSSLLKKTLTLVGRKPVNMIRNGTPLFVNAPASASAGMHQPERLSSFRSGVINSKGEDTLAKVMANSCLSLTHRPTSGKMSGPAGARKTPGQTGMVNHDHQYSSRLSNENVTRLETQIKSLQAENHGLNAEVEKLRKQLAAANTYIATSLSAAVLPTPSRTHQPTTFATPVRSHTQPIRSNAQVFRAQSIRAQPQGIRVQAQATRAQAQVVRGQQFRAQTVRPQQFRQRAPTPVRATPYQRAANPGVMVVPVRKPMQPITLRPLRASTQALTVIPIRRGTRVLEPEAEMPSFEQVNVNEHFGMHFLTE